MDIFNPICDDDDNIEYIGWGDGNSVGYGTGRPDGYHPLPKCETYLYGDEWEKDGCGAGVAKGSGVDYYDD
ncbi:MAG: hypothetical protein CMP21_03485 [Rickettsiales bacterium]|nr:hypothetical protein [Rickettsiales bacterium]|tara:strand:+ start:3879 stop:4091 length:213 start_codon:yes stop_codon:yes gene_type:complete